MWGTADLGSGRRQIEYLVMWTPSGCRGQDTGKTPDLLGFRLNALGKVPKGIGAFQVRQVEPFAGDSGNT